MSQHQSQTGELPKGSIFAERFEVDKLLGEGTFGAVYRAYDLANARALVAFKILAPKPAAAKMESFRVSARRFQIEIETTGAIESPRVPKLVGSGVDRNGTRYMALEYVDGRSLDQLIARWRRLDFPVIARITEHLLEALRETHAIGMVHRDLKPQNIMVKRETGDTLLIDFGIASTYQNVQGMQGADLTRDGVAVGTLPYIAPEMLLGSSATPASDLFALGLVLAELLSAKPAFADMDDRSKALSLLSQEPIVMPYRPDSPRWLIQLADALLVKDPARRPANAGQLIERIHAIKGDPLDDESTGEFHANDLIRQRYDGDDFEPTGVVNIEDLL